MNVWRLITHHEDKDRALLWSKQNGRIAIGWGAIGDIRKQGYQSDKEISLAIKSEYPELNNWALGGPSLWDFYAEMKKGDLVILSANQPRVLVVEVEEEDGDYEWTNEPPGPTEDYQHQRRVLIRRAQDPEDLWIRAGGEAPGQNVHRTLIRCAHPADLDNW
jgi:predicted Mrr-cat superfamily restriction endonuclease